jgi:hypothetical protein
MLIARLGMCLKAESGQRLPAIMSLGNHSEIMPYFSLIMALKLFSTNSARRTAINAT